MAPMKQKQEENVSTELSHWFDYQLMITNDHDDRGIDHGDQQDLSTANDIDQDVVTRDFLLEVTKTNNNNNNNEVAVVMPHPPYDVSTELELYGDPWKIKKRLTKSDLADRQGRLLLHSRSVQRHVLPFMSPAALEQVESHGLRVSVWDHDTDSVHQLVFKRWKDSSGAYILSFKWTKDFVRRRDLKEGDQIGLLWDHHRLTFGFCVLHRIHG